MGNHSILFVLGTGLWFFCGIFVMACGSEPVAAPVAVPEAVVAAPEPPPAPEPEPQAMDLERMDATLQAVGSEVVRDRNIWRLSLDGIPLVVITDSQADRVRIVGVVGPAQDLTPEQVQLILVANFHTALDARYAVSEGMLTSVFIHRLSTLNEEDLANGVRQTATLARTFGTSYSSGELIYGGR